MPITFHHLKTYQGTKTVNACPMSRVDAEKELDRIINPARNDEDGYLVEYKDGYRSWSPKSAFEEAYRPASTFIDRMHIECDELAKRRDSLHDFFNTPKFKELDNFDQYLLLHQYTAMGDYLSVLRIRIERAENNNPDKANTL